MDQEQTFKQLKFRCLNLRTSTERKNYVQQQFDKENILVTFIDGINSKQLGLEHEKIRGGQLGCSLSHIINLKEISRLNSKDHFVVFEDDISLSDHFADNLVEFMGMIHDEIFDIAYIGWWARWNDNSKLVTTDVNARWMKITEHGHWGSYGYVINGSKSAEKISKLMEENFNDNNDEVLSKLSLSNQIDSLFLKNPIVQYTELFASQTQ